MVACVSRHPVLISNHEKCDKYFWGSMGLAVFKATGRIKSNALKTTTLRQHPGRRCWKTSSLSHTARNYTAVPNKLETLCKYKYF